VAASDSAQDQLQVAVDIHQDRILILDFGAQYTQLIARRIREIGVYCEIYAWDVSAGAIRAFAPRAIVLSGGPESTIADDPPQVADIVFGLGRCPKRNIFWRASSGDVKT